MQIIPIILCSIAAPLVFLLLTYWMDRKQPEPLPQLLKAVTLGGVVALLSLSFTAVLNNAEWIYVGDITSWSHFKQAFFGAAFPEEASKLIMLYILLKNNKYFDKFFDGIVYAVFIAMGFAAVENICYALTNPEGWETVLIGRSILSVPAHFCYTIVMGACFSCWHFKGIKPYFWLAFGVPFLMHGLFDFCLNEITPSNGTASMIAILVVFALLLTAMATFAYRGIAETTKIDAYLRNMERQYAWRNRNIRHYTIILLTLCSTVMFSSGTKIKNKPPHYILSPELTEFRDKFCQKVRNSFDINSKKPDEPTLYEGLAEALCKFDKEAFEHNNEFAMIDRTVRYDTLHLQNTNADVSDSLRQHHLEYNPYFINNYVQHLSVAHPSKPDMMYEIIHKLTTDGNASVASMTECQCYSNVVPAKTSVTYTYQCFGNQELLLVSENGGDLRLIVTNLTTGKPYTPQTSNGASWLTWEMKKLGPCSITVCNPNSKDLSFVLATTKKE